MFIMPVVISKKFRHVSNQLHHAIFSEVTFSHIINYVNNQLPLIQTAIAMQCDK